MMYNNIMKLNKNINNKFNNNNLNIIIIINFDINIKMMYNIIFVEEVKK